MYQAAKFFTELPIEVQAFQVQALQSRVPGLTAERAQGILTKTNFVYGLNPNTEEIECLQQSKLEFLVMALTF